jgi:hypothetical protein
LAIRLVNRSASATSWSRNVCTDHRSQTLEARAAFPEPPRGFDVKFAPSRGFSGPEQLNNADLPPALIVDDADLGVA